MLEIDLDREKIERARSLSESITDKVQAMIDRHTTHSVERSVLRLMGLDGLSGQGHILPNALVSHLAHRLENGVAAIVASAMLRTGKSLRELAEAVADGFLDIGDEEISDPQKARDLALDLTRASFNKIDAQIRARRAAIDKLGQGEQPWMYVIVATGNIYEDAIQADMCVRQGADVVAVIRTTGQSLLDYVPHGATTEGFGGTYATRENFRIMRKALDEAGERQGRYIRLVNYASGLCMPEISVMGALERLDMMLNDCMYGILFRDINPVRTFVDQHFSRMINAYAEVIINTGEDNYLTTSDAVEKGHTVLASDFINQAFASKSGLKPEQMGLGHAFEIDPTVPDSFCLELAMAALVRACFPQSPIKYMPPTKHMTGDVFFGYVLNAMFNLAGVMTGQGIQLLGMLTEAIHTPFASDRFLALQNARYVFNAARGFGDQIRLDPDGSIAKRARQVLEQAVEMLENIQSIGLLESIGRGDFADIRRTREGGRGAKGVIEKGPEYFNPATALLSGSIDASVPEKERL